MSSFYSWLRVDLFWLGLTVKSFAWLAAPWKVPVKIWTTGHWTPSSRLEKRTLRYESSLKTVFEIGLLNDLLCTLLYTLCQIRWDRVASACYKISCLLGQLTNKGCQTCQTCQKYGNLKPTIINWELKMQDTDGYAGTVRIICFIQRLCQCSAKTFLSLSKFTMLINWDTFLAVIFHSCW